MKIAINLLPLRDYTGIEVFTENLISELSKRFPNIEIILIKHSFSPSFLNFDGENIRNITIPIKKRRKGWVALFQQSGIYFVLRRIEPDFLLCPSIAAPFFYTKKVAVVHDCAYDRFPEEWSGLLSKLHTKLMYAGAKYFSKKIITISRFSKRELIHYYKIKPERIAIISEGPPHLPNVTPSFVRKTLKKFNIRAPYFLYIGSTRPRKNIPRLLNAFKAFRSNSPQFLLILGGSIDTRFLDIVSEIKRFGLQNSVIQTGFLSNEEKSALYRRAVALTLPSLYEGFGLPVLEAQSVGIPVLTSNTSSLPQVAGEGASFVDPYSIESIASGMNRIAEDVALRRVLIEKGYENVKRFSWGRTARELVDILKSINHENTSR